MTYEKNSHDTDLLMHRPVLQNCPGSPQLHGLCSILLRIKSIEHASGIFSPLKIFFFLIVALLFFGQPAEAREWTAIKKSGVLRVGIRDSSGMLYSNRNQQESGLMYEMAHDFASSHNLQLKVIVVAGFADYWMHNGEILLKTNKLATPDIYSNIDIAAEIFTVTPERQKLVQLTPYIENIELIYGRKGDYIENYRHLIGKRLLTYEAMSFSKVIQNELQRQSIPFVKSYVSISEGYVVQQSSRNIDPDMVNLFLIPKDSPLRGKGNYFEIAQNQADASIADGLNMMFRLYENTFFKENLKPLFPARSELSQLAWGSRLEDKTLHENLLRFFSEDKTSGKFSKRLEKYTGFNFKEYQEIIRIQSID